MLKLILKPIVLLCLMWSITSYAVDDKNQSVVYILHNSFLSTAKVATLSQMAKPYNITVKSWQVNDNPELPDDIHQATLIIIDATRSHDLTKLHTQLTTFLEQTPIAWVSRNKQSHNLPANVASTITAYYENGGDQNYQALFEYLNRYVQFHDDKVTQEPEVLPETGFYHPEAPHIFTSIKQLIEWKQQTLLAEQPNVLFTIHANTIADGELETIKYIAEQAKIKGIFPLFYWFDSQKSDVLASIANQYPLDAIVNMQHMQNLELRKAEFKQLNIPVLQTMNYRQGDILTWELSPSGVPPQITAMFITIPESTGFSDPMVISAIENGNVIPITRQLDALIDKLVRLSKLKHTSNQDKKLALLFWNHPGGENNIAASHLNVPKSIANIIHELQQAGYQLTDTSEDEAIKQAKQMLLGYYDHKTLSDLLSQNLADKLPLNDYLHFLDMLPEQQKKQLLKTWGEPQKHWAYQKDDSGGYFIIPRAKLGHLMIMPQPPRAGDPNAHYHDTTSLPDHIYLAGYLYIQKQFHADALIHLGTHGTQEWLPGKDRGLDVNDFAFLPLADLPVFYPYIQDNIGEAIQVRRRGRGVTISHQTPIFSPSGLYEELRDINQLVHEYHQIDDGMVKETLKEKIDHLVFDSSLTISQDLGWDKEKAHLDYEHFLADLHDYLDDIATKAIPLGLHTFGQANDAELRLMTILMQLGEPYYSLFSTDSKTLFTQDLTAIKQQPIYTTLEHYLRGHGDANQIKDPKLKEQIIKAQQFDHNLSDMKEMSALINGLNGGFIVPCSGGDPVRSPELSNGCNLYGFEPSKMPTTSAYASGTIAFNQLIDNYKQTHNGEYPTKLAFSLWSSEAIRHSGVTESQILNALGLRPVWLPNGQVKKLEIIPSSELTHPRIDVVVQVTGVYRDQFDIFMRLLAEAIEELAEYDEPNNPIRLNSQKLTEQLTQQGIPLSQAITYSRLRVFSGKMGSYGTKTTHLTLDSEHWDSDQVIAERYLSNLQYGYGTNDDNWQVSLNNINLYGEQLKNVDAAILARSSNLNGILSTDHPFEFLGGISLAVKHLKGEAPELYISDLRQQQPKTVAASKYLSTELTAQFLNPKWISEMQKEGYAGTLEILDMANNLWGWQVTDQSMVRDDQWSALHQVFVKDKYNLQLNEWYEKNNPSAQLQLIERMVEAIRKDYWQADDQTKKELVERWQQLAQQVPLLDDHKITRQFIDQMAAGFGLNQPTEQSEPQAQEPPVIRGQLLNEVTVINDNQDDLIYIICGLLFIFATLLSGAFYQIKTNSKGNH